MTQQYNFLKTYTKQLIARGRSTSDVSLWNGKMGIAIYLLHLSRITQTKDYEIQAKKFIEEVYNTISNQQLFSFGYGLLGIGCGFEYIIEKKFMGGDSDEILQEVDYVAKQIINSRNINKFDLGNGVCGVGFYLYYRLRSKSENDDKLISLSLKEHLIYLTDWIEELLLITNENQDHNNAYFLLIRLRKLNIFNFKIEKLIDFCLQKMYNSDCLFFDNYEMLGINHLTVLKPWI